MLKGCSTAMVTPMRDDGSVDYDGLERLLEFQISSGVQGVLAVGTTGESPTLLWEEHNQVTETTCRMAKGKCMSIAGTGSNSTRETLAGTEHAAHVGADAVLLVDPYYNGPSTIEIRREYVEPVASEFPDMQIIPYIIPGPHGNNDARRGPRHSDAHLSQCVGGKGGHGRFREHGQDAASVPRRLYHPLRGRRQDR